MDSSIKVESYSLYIISIPEDQNIKPFLFDLIQEEEEEICKSFLKVNHQDRIKCHIGMDAAIFIPLSGEKLLEKFKYLSNKLTKTKYIHVYFVMSLNHWMQIINHFHQFIYT